MPPNAFRQPYRPSAHEKLGALVHELPIRPFIRRAQLIIAPLLVALGVAWMVLLTRIPVRSSADAWIAGAMELFFASVPALGVYSGWKAFRSRDLRVEIREAGIVHRRAGKEMLILWDEIREAKIAWIVVSGIDTHRYVVRAHDGRRVTLTHELKGIHAIRRTLEREIVRSMLPRDLRMLDAGGMVAFGRFAVTATHLHCGQRKLEWAEIESVDVKDGQICVYRVGTKTRVPAWVAPRRTWAWRRYADVPNAAVLLTLARHFGRGALSEAA